MIVHVLRTYILMRLVGVYNDTPILYAHILKLLYSQAVVALVVTMDRRVLMSLNEERMMVLQTSCGKVFHV